VLAAGIGEGDEGWTPDMGRATAEGMVTAGTGRAGEAGGGDRRPGAACGDAAGVALASARGEGRPTGALTLRGGVRKG